MSSTSTTRGGYPVSQQVGLVFGGVYALVGVIGFAVTSGVGFADTDGGKILGIFEVNPLHNVVHLAIAAVLIAAALSGSAASRVVNATVGATYLLVGVVGLFVLSSSANILALNGADNGLHVASALILLIAGLTRPAGNQPTEVTTDVRSRARR